MTKDQFIYIIKTFFEGSDGGGGGNKRYHLGDIERHIEMAFADTVEHLYRQAIQYHDWGHIDPLVKTYLHQQAEYDNDRCEYYVKFPVSVLQLPENGGVRQVWIGKDQRSLLTYMPNNAVGIYDTIMEYDGLFSTSYPFYIENYGVYIPVSESVGLKKVNFKLIPSFSAWDSQEDVPTVFGKDGVVFDQVVNRLASMFPSDDINDSSPKKANTQ